MTHTEQGYGGRWYAYGEHDDGGGPMGSGWTEQEAIDAYNVAAEPPGEPWRGPSTEEWVQRIAAPSLREGETVPFVKPRTGGVR